MTPVPDAVIDLARTARLVVVVEDGVRQGGVGSSVSQALRDRGIDVPVRNLGIPVAFLDQGKRAQILGDLGLTAQEIARSIVEQVASGLGQGGDAAGQEPLVVDPQRGT